ncbi:T9SS type A sorting domain-containing protein, partial [candidate division TA06 bacterium]
GSTVITYSLPVPGRVKLQIYDVSGRFVETVVDEKQVAGIYAFRWEAADKATGMYFCRLEAGDFTDVKKMILLR